MTAEPSSGAAPGAVERRAAVLGSPVGHSLSPVLHREAYAGLGLPWSYEARECDERALPGLLVEVRREAAAWVGLSLTMPLKETVLPLLDAVDPVAASLGAVNTVTVGADGSLGGGNTDVDGVRAALVELPSGTADPGPVVVLGAGGTARAAVAALRGVGAPVVLAARSSARAEPVLALARDLGLDARHLPFDEVPDVLPGAGLVVATVPATAAAGLASVLRAGSGWPASTPLLDVLYAPWPSPLAALAAEVGAPHVGGLAVLVGQAVEQVHRWSGRRPDAVAMRRAGERALAGRP